MCISDHAYLIFFLNSHPILACNKPVITSLDSKCCGWLEIAYSEKKKFKISFEFSLTHILGTWTKYIQILCKNVTSVVPSLTPSRVFALIWHPWAQFNCSDACESSEVSPKAVSISADFLLLGVYFGSQGYGLSWRGSQGSGAWGSWSHRICC